MSLNKVAVITGGAKGLGLEAAKLLARDHQVVLTARSEKAGQQAQLALAESGTEVDFLPLDISSDESVDLFMKALMARYGRCDVLINNAAIFFDWENSASQIDLSELSATFETNVIGSARISKALMPLLLASDNGKVIFLSSDLGSLNYAADPEHEYFPINGLAYRISKSALNMYALALAKECDDTQIAVTVVSPGWCKTDMGTDKAPRSAIEGAQSIYMAVKGDGKQFHRKFILDGNELAW
ncbi:SDR family NAD(P)-dependent oxidoreductase [Pseudoalteromonas sp. S4498]|uniref:SDR family NAD(P)-dependent oxidoreductase n=1 Tax=Pseudoalteromonas galatheae TaxID=579562 RepID=UPI0011093710|nr:SDR family NAD(P)-dependent oxidoreductase [Pseudoalteromonas galatheae]NKC20445.1 SDR family NAD(P)-dependent oxidoreductase [Pseudoalteromonas galatheae]